MSLAGLSSGCACALKCVCAFPPLCYFLWVLHQCLAAAPITCGTVFANLSASTFACSLLLSHKEALLSLLLCVGLLIVVCMV